ncbi:MAG: hypothetical protein QOE66_346 [Chloroflexota bacterium]|jgi:hypothetical protein|nr:hypothetical protein [Chloroflexota bacterium]
MSDAASPTVPASKLDRFVAKYRQDHRHPVNHVLHVGVGWPLCALAVILLPFHPPWSVGLFLGGYALMFFGHFVFEKNVPTVLKHPSTPFVIAWAVIRGLGTGLLRLVTPSRGR